MTYVERLTTALQQQLRHPWTPDRSGGERVWFLVFDPDKLRTVLASKAEFQHVTEAAHRRWVEFDVSERFGQWMAAHRYAKQYFARPNRASTLPDDFAAWLQDEIRRFITAEAVDDRTLLVLTGTEALFGINKLSHITRLIEDAVPGRLLVFFPGTFSEPQYRFLDASDGWNYLAVPILPVSEGARG